MWWEAIYFYLRRTPAPHLIAALTFGLAGGLALEEGIRQSAEVLTVPGTALIGAAVSELARLLNNIAEREMERKASRILRLTSEDQEDLVRGILRIRTLLEETPGIPTNIRQEQLEALRKYQQLIGDLGSLTPKQRDEIVHYLTYLKHEYPERLERYARTYWRAIGTREGRDS